MTMLAYCMPKIRLQVQYQIHRYCALVDLGASGRDMVALTEVNKSLVAGATTALAYARASQRLRSEWDWCCLNPAGQK
jgi:hypothetical protein